MSRNGAELLRQMSRVAGSLYGSAAVLVALSLLLAPGAHDHPLGVAVIAGAGALAALAWWVVGERLAIPARLHHLGGIGGSLLVGLLVLAAGPPFAAVYGILLLYVAAFSFFYFRRATALAQALFAALVYGAALWRLDGALPRPSYWIVVVGAAVVGAGLVGVLGQRTRELLTREHAAGVRLAELDRQKDAFLRMLSHDLRGPLATMVGIADTLDAHLEDLDADTVRELARRQAAQGRHLGRLVNDLLDVERLRSRALQPDRQSVRLDSLVEQRVELAGGEQARIELDLEPVEALVDPTLVEQAVENLLTNALRHTPTDSPVSVRLRAEDDGWQLVVEDRGPGVADEHKEAVFELFDSGPHPSTTSGVGLALVREVVVAHGGRAWVEDRPDGGARFCLWSPGAGPASTRRRDAP